jgi:flagellar basal-body rod protein FlgB
MTATTGGQNPETLYRTPQSLSLDGNTVELHVEQLKFAENATRYEASLQFLNDRIRGLRTALRGE